MRIQPIKKLEGSVTVPGDKSISHRGIMLGSLAEGTTIVRDFLPAADCLSTISCFRQLGIAIQQDGQDVIVQGKGLRGLSQPKTTLDVGNSGTTFRLMSGILSAQAFDTALTGDASIQKRPMDRIVKPLRLMGAQLDGKEDGKFAPIHIKGQSLKSITYKSPVASAQVKSSILLAGLYANGETTVIEPNKSRDHTERMLAYFGHPLEIDGKKVTTTTCNELYSREVIVPGDISSAAYFLVAGSITPNSEILIKNVGINPTRTGILDVLKAMGADINYLNQRSVSGEPVADLQVKSSTLKSTIIGGEVIPRLIDEIPVIAVAACFAEGKTIIKDAAELKVKESNRIATVVSELSKMGAEVIETEDGMVITGTGYLNGAKVESFHDHRIAMSLAVAGLLAEGETWINNSDSVRISYPQFYDDLKKLTF
ncbi:3-phosphoshikimate 1-carboxyvinyltransferase [Vallitalea okinawensis]|uniref:3-phosphoshikimate 1-carboxyvinyltransferase n=1 Tax=Vallitalea okinawensis TaxID=2078660 RepID=UPI000CFA911A|nr:3-phosphoshikimate 1-carboxyvinyltransferase [Vallitalea okinawensis]